VIKKIRITGGRPVTRTPGDFRISNPAWSEAGWMVVQTPAGLTRVPDTGGAPEYLTRTDTTSGEIHRDPRLLLGETALIYTRGRYGELDEIVIFDLETGDERVLLENAEDATYLPTGHLVFVRDNTLYAVPFDLDTFGFAGTETPILEDLRGPYAVSPTGHLVYTESVEESDRRVSTLAWMTPSGAEDPLSAESMAWDDDLRLTEDGNQVVGSIRQATADGSRSAQLWRYDFERSVLTPLTFDGIHLDPIWSPDGRQVTYRFDENGQTSIRRMSLVGSGATELLLEGTEQNVTITPKDWTPDGATLLFVKDPPGPPGAEIRELWTLQAPFGEDARPRLLLSALNISDARISPDGTFVAYDSGDSGRSEVYVVPLTGSGTKVQVSTQGGRGLFWAANGGQIFYRQSSRSEPQKLMSVDVERSPSLTLGPPRELLELPSRVIPADVAGNGERFLVVRRSTDSRRFVLVTNWFKEVERLVRRD
jgi:serine/threonine-protein kinase